METSKSNTKRRIFFNVLEDVFLGKVKNIEGLSATVKLMKIKNKYYQNAIKPTLEREIKEIIDRYPEFEEELYDKLYTFFSRYFTESGTIAFEKTLFHNNIYDKVYTNEKDVILFWKTRDLYYIKTEKVFRSMEFDYGDYHFVFDASQVEGKRGNEKRSVIFTLKRIEGKTITFEVHYKEGNRETPVRDILRKLKNHKINLTEEDLEEVLRIYNRQTEIDFFIHKRPREFLKEQFNLWLYQYLSTDHEWPVERLNQFNLLRRVAFKLIDMIAQFEEEILKIWLKPRFVLNSNYVISLDRIAEKRGWHIIEKLQRHSGWLAQVKEWIELGIIDKEPDNLIEENLLEKRLKREYQFLPVDTKYFKDLETEITKLFDNLDEELDGWLIKSENFQALNTILPRFRGKVQTIYIDPPFNKEQDADYYYIVKYKDSTWASMLENRLRLAREFLNDTGAIFVRCDCNGNWIVRFLLDEIFGKENFKNELIIRRKRQAMGTPSKFEVENEYLYFYGKSEKTLRKDIYVERDTSKLKWVGFLKQGDRTPPQRVFMGKVLYPPKGQHFSLRQEKVDKLLQEHYLRVRCKNCSTLYYYDAEDSRENFVSKIDLSDYRYRDCFKKAVFGVKKLEVCLKCGADEWNVEYLPSEVRKLGNLWIDIPSYSDTNDFPTENSEILLKYIIESTSNEGDLVMDFFLGSGTTCAVAHKLGRKWIGIEMGEHFYNIVLPRMKKVLAYDKSGISKEPDVKEVYNSSKAGGFFKYYELEQFEDIIERAQFSGNPCKISGHTDMFTSDIKFSYCLKVSPDDTLEVSLNEVYPDKKIDIDETISNLTGNQIKVVDDACKFNIIKDLIYW